MSGKSFFDTNVLIYASVNHEPRTAIARELLAGGGVISVQMLNEFVNIALRKLKLPWVDILQALNAIRVLFPSPVPLTLETHEAALRITDRYGFRIYDSLVIAAALENSCTTLYSEDLQDGQIIDGVLTVCNPFQES